MKVLIWIGSFIAITLLNLILVAFTGFKLGYGLSFIAYFILPRFLCKKWDVHKLKKELKSISAKAAAEGMTAKEYIHKDIPKNCIEICEFYKGKSKELEPYLKTLLEDKKISKDAYIYLYEEYRK